MEKTRLEFLSDGIFAIVFTLMVIEIKVPETLVTKDTYHLLEALVELGPLFFAYVVSFTVLAMFWVSHNFLYSIFVKNINRQLLYLNLLYLSFIALIPFSAHLIGRYGAMDLAVVVYGLHILLISIISNIIFYYALKSNEIDTDHVTSKLIKQARIRQGVTLVFTTIGIALALFSFNKAAFVVYMLPIIFNIIPGSLDYFENKFGIEIK